MTRGIKRGAKHNFGPGKLVLKTHGCMASLPLGKRPHLPQQCQQWRPRSDLDVIQWSGSIHTAYLQISLKVHVYDRM